MRSYITSFFILCVALTLSTCHRQGDRADIFDIECTDKLVGFPLRAEVGKSDEFFCYLCFEVGNHSGSYTIVDKKGKKMVIEGTFFEGAFYPPVPDPYHGDVAGILAALQSGKLMVAEVRSEEE